MGFPKIDTLYTLYLRGKLTKRFPPGLDPVAFFNCLRADARTHRSHKAKKSDSLTFSSLMDVDFQEGLQVPRDSIDFAEVIWASGMREEFRIPLEFLSHSALTDTMVSVRDIVGDVGVRAVRLSWEKGLIGDIRFAYVLFVSGSHPEFKNMACVEHGSPRSFITIIGFDSLSPFETQVYRTVFSSNETDDVCGIVGPAANSILNQDREDHTPATVARIAALAAVLKDQRHRYVVPQVDRRVRKTKWDPVIYLVGAGVTPVDLCDGATTLKHGFARWAKFGENDRQLLIEWPEYLDSRPIGETSDGFQWKRVSTETGQVKVHPWGSQRQSQGE